MAYPMKKRAKDQIKRDLGILLFHWSCRTCSKNGQVRAIATDANQRVLTSHYLVSPTCKNPVLDIQ